MTAAEFLAGWTVRSLILIAVGVSLLWLSRPRNASLRAAAWSAILFGSCAIPIVNFIPTVFDLAPKTFLPALRHTAAGVVVRPIPPSERISDAPPVTAPTPQVSTPVLKRDSRPAKNSSADVGAGIDVDWVRVILMFYAAVCAGFLLRICAGLWFGFLLRRRCRATGDLCDGVRILESNEIAAPLTLGVWRPAIVLPSDWRKWDCRTLDAVLAHERSHVRRHDPWVQLLSRTHRALLWINPLSWFLHRRIVQTAEEVSDDAAVGAIQDRIFYAETLVGFMRHRVANSGWAGVSMARYCSPEKRVRRILNSRTLARGVTSRSIATIVAVASPFTYVIATAQTRPQFEVADVHVSAPAANSRMRGGGIRAGVYQIQMATMLDLIKAAYSVDADKIVGGPSWLELDRYDVFAKAPNSTSLDSARLMLQALLTDRFKLVLHADSRPLPGFALTVARGGTPKLKKADGSGNTGCTMTLRYTQEELAARRHALILAGNTNPVILQTNLFRCQNMTMSAFAARFRGMPNGQQQFANVADRTGLGGQWDFNFQYTTQPPPGASEIDGESVTIFEALEKQLGLKLEAAQVSTAVMVVDSVDRKPTENPADVKTILPPPPPAAFEVADLKLSAPGAPEVGSPGPQPGGRFEVRNFPLSFLIMIAWGLNSNSTLTGAPDWLNGVRVDLIAKLPSTDETRAVRGVADMDEFQPALRTLLTERFKIAIHTEQRPVQGYALVATKPKMRKADPSLRTKCFEGPAAGGKDPRPSNLLLSRLITCQNITLPEFAERLPGLSGAYLRNQLVVDSSGIDGRYDFTLSFSAGRGGPGAEVAVPEGGITLFEALEKQVGLKLEKRSIPAPVVILDHIERKPAEN
jgi:uncharacterized protein (TIGR03435 family)